MSLEAVRIWGCIPSQRRAIQCGEEVRQKGVWGFWGRVSCEKITRKCVILKRLFSQVYYAEKSPLR